MSDKELATDPEIYKNDIITPHVQPKVIGYINLENLKFVRRVRDEQVNYDLDLLYDETEHKSEDVDLKITELLTFLLHHRIRLNFPFESALESSKFFCNRGVLTRIALTPYTSQEISSWKIVAVLSKGNIYLCVRETELKKKMIKCMTEMDKRRTAWGYKFEQYVQSDTPDSDPNPNRPVEETAEFALVFEANLLLHSIVYRAEVDGLRCDGAPVPHPPSDDEGPEDVIEYLAANDFIELKTIKQPKSKMQYYNLRRHKTLKWWCQAYLTGISDVLCGYRNYDNERIVGRLQVFPLRDMARMAKEKSNWRNEVCLYFLDAFLTFVKRCLSDEIARKHGDRALKKLHTVPLTSLMFQWEPGCPVRVSDYVHEDDPILPSWFIEQYKPVASD